MNPFLAEFAGTLFLLVLGLGVNASVALQNAYARSAGWLTVCIGWGIAVTLSVYAAGPHSGAHLNPAVTLAMALTGTLPWSDVPGYLAAQMAGGILAGMLVYLHFLPHWKVTGDPAVKLGVFSTGPAMDRPLANLWSEVLATAVFILGLFFIGQNRFSEGLNPVVVGALVTSIGLSLGSTTGFAINPARDLGPRIAHALLPIAGKGPSGWSYAWIPVAGPMAGAVLAWLIKSALLG